MCKGVALQPGDGVSRLEGQQSSTGEAGAWCGDGQAQGSTSVLPFMRELGVTGIAGEHGAQQGLSQEAPPGPLDYTSARVLFTAPKKRD